MQSRPSGSHQQVPDPLLMEGTGWKQALNFVSSSVRACVRACMRLCVCVCVFMFVPIPGVGRLRSSGLHQGQMCNSVRSASVSHSLSLIPLHALLPQAL